MQKRNASRSGKAPTARRKSIDPEFRPTAYRWPRRRAGAKPEAVETVVARIELSTPHREAITLRARRGADGRIRFRMLHEDRASPPRRIRISPASSARPLSFGELVALLDSACYEGAPADERDHARFGGVIWGTLQVHFDHGVGH